jgi:hypothetical protein
MLCYRRPWITKKIQVNFLIHGYINAPDRFGTHLHVSVKLSISFLEDTWLSCESHFQVPTNMYISLTSFCVGDLEYLA